MNRIFFIAVLLNLSIATAYADEYRPAYLEFKQTKYLKERKAEFYTEKPVQIEVSGNYHQLGMFVSRVSSLPRIVTLHNYKITAPKSRNKDANNTRLTLNITAKTYRYDSSSDDSACARSGS